MGLKAMPRDDYHVRRENRGEIIKLKRMQDRVSFSQAFQLPPLGLELKSV
jgi:hypothetical protein